MSRWLLLLVGCCVIIGYYSVGSWMEIVHRFQETYPFGRDFEEDNTFVDLVRAGLSEEQMLGYRDGARLMREVVSPYLMRLCKMFKEDDSLHFFYDYYPVSLEMFLRDMSERKNGKIEHSLYKSITAAFTTAVGYLIEVLIHHQIQADLLIANMAAMGDDEAYELKIFIDPASKVLKEQSGEAAAVLGQFYQAQQKRLKIQMEEIIDKYFGKFRPTLEPNQPNFIIEGSKLVFLNKDGSRLNKTEEDKPEEDEGLVKRSHDPVRLNKETKEARLSFEHFDQRPLLTGSKQGDHKKDLVDKHKEKVEAIKNSLQRLENKNNFEALQKDSLRFKDKKGIHNEATGISNNSDNDPPRMFIDSERHSMPVSSLSRPNFSERGSRNSQEDEGKKGEPKELLKSGSKEEKLDKYKMKIMATYDIELEGPGEQNIQEVEKDIWEGIRSGKISMEDLRGQHPKLVVEKVEAGLNSQNRIDDMRTSIENPRDSGLDPKNKRIQEILGKIKGQKSSQQVSPQVKKVNGSEVPDYMQKVRSAKNKAEQVLKQYAQKKQ